MLACLDKLLDCRILQPGQNRVSDSPGRLCDYSWGPSITEYACRGERTEFEHENLQDPRFPVWLLVCKELKPPFHGTHSFFWGEYGFCFQ